MKKAAFIYITVLIAGLQAGICTDHLPFLKIKSSARSASLGEGAAALSGDSALLLMNPATLSGLNNPEANLMHMVNIGDTSYEYGSFALPVGKNLRLAASVIYLNYGSLALTTEDTNGIYTGTTGSLTPSDLAFAVSGAIQMNKTMSLGATVKYASENLGTTTASAILLDAGLIADLKSFNLGLSVLNLGAASGDEVAPGRIIAAVSVLMDELILLGGAEYAVAGGKIAGSAGAEYCYANLLVVRGSYSLGRDAETLNAGAGLKGNLYEYAYRLDYNFSLMGDNLSSAHRISLTVGFGAEEKASSRTPKQNNNSKNGLRYYSPGSGRGR